MSLQADQFDLSQPCFIGEVLQPFYFFSAPLSGPASTDPCPLLGPAKMNAVLQIESQQSKAGGENHLPHPARHAVFDAARVGFLDCVPTLPNHVQLFIYQYFQVLLCRAALSALIL